MLSVNVLPQTDVLGNRYLYDAMDNQIMSVNAMGDTVQTTYNVFNKTASQTDALGNVTVFEYDLFGQLSRTIAPDGTAIRKLYDSQGKVTHSIDEAGRVTQFEYDHENRITRTIANDGSSTRVEYDALGRRTASIDANNNRTEYEYDAVGNNTLVRDASGNVTRYEYDAANRRTAMVDALNHRTEYGYDEYDRLVRTTFDDGTFSTTTYDLAGRKTETDPEGKTTAFAYDSVGNLRSVTDAMGHVTRYTYDEHNNRITQTDANNHTTTIQYDKLNRLTARIYPNGDTERFGYNANGNQIFKVDGNGDSTVYTYDNRNREVLKRFTNSGHTVETRYTDDGKPDTIVDHRGMTTYEYGSCCSQLLKVTNPDNTFIEYGYDNNKNIISRATPWDTTSYSFDILNRMKTVTSVNGERTEYFYDNIGKRDSTANSNGTSTRYQYDNLNRLTRITNYNSNGIISDFAYTLNNAGIKIGVTEHDGSVVTYSYDDLYRLTGETRTGTNPYTLTYSYDNVGNRLTKNLNGEVTSYTYNNRDQLDCETGSFGTVCYEFDAAGRQISRDSVGIITTFTWADNDRLQSVSNQNGTNTFTYDLTGQKISSANGSEVQNYLIDYKLPYGQIVSEYSDDLSNRASYMYGLDRIALRRSGMTSFYSIDGQKSVRNLTDAAGTVTDSYSYYGFGELLSSAGTTVNSFRYVGEELNEFSGMYNLRARWYSNSNGRFLNIDPYQGCARTTESLHRYIYAKNSPISYSDPNGKFYTVQSLLFGTAYSSNLRATYEAVKKPVYTKAITDAIIIVAVSYVVATTIESVLLQKDDDRIETVGPPGGDDSFKNKKLFEKYNQQKEDCQFIWDTGMGTCQQLTGTARISCQVATVMAWAACLLSNMRN
jgi:RHS repeat-associated protein